MGSSRHDVNHIIIVIIIIIIFIVIIVIIISIIIFIVNIICFINIVYIFLNLSNYRTQRLHNIHFLFHKITLFVYSDISVDFKCSVLDECIEEGNIN